MFKRRLRILLILGSFVGLICATVFIVVNPVVGTVESAQLPVDVSVMRLTADVEAICNQFGPRDYKNVEGLNAVATYIGEAFTEAGLVAQEQSYVIDGSVYKNVIAAYGPVDAPTWIVGAHYDACDVHAGADDNASGVAGLLELARMLGESEPDLSYRIELVAYTLEEPPFFGTQQMGSAVHAQSMIDDHVEVLGMMCLEMIGFYSDEPNSQSYPNDAMKVAYPSTGNFITVVGEMDSPMLVRGIKKDMMAGGDIDVQSINAPASVPGIDFSDHRNYWAHDIPAVMITNTAFYRNENYHLASDLPKTLDYNRMKEVVKGVYWAIAHRN